MPMISDHSLKATARQWDDNRIEYVDDEVKAKAHKDAARLLRHFARHALNLPDDKFDVRANKAGIAVSGEVTLHTDPFPGHERGIYIQIGQSAFGDNTILYRGCKSRADYTGFVNNFTTVTRAFGDNGAMARFAAEVRKIVFSNDPTTIGMPGHF